MNGIQFKEYWDSITDQAFSDWFDSTQLNILAKAALYKAIEYKVATNDRQQVHDDLFSLVSMSDETGTNNFTPTYNRVDLLTTIPNYLHVLAVRCFMEEPLMASMTDITNTSPITITLDKRTKLRGRKTLSATPSIVKIANVAGNTAANGTHTVKQLSDFKYSLYSDTLLTQEVSGNGTWTGGGDIFMVWKEWAQPINSNERISEVNRAKVISPRYSIADGTLVLFPLEYACNQVAIDYIKKPTVLINVTDSAIDLESAYSQRFLYLIADELAYIAKASQKDYEMAQAAQAEIQKP